MKGCYREHCNNIIVSLPYVYMSTFYLLSRTSYNNVQKLFGNLKATSLSSGFCLGSCNWLLETEYCKVRTYMILIDGAHVQHAHTCTHAHRSTYTHMHTPIHTHARNYAHTLNLHTHKCT